MNVVILYSVLSDWTYNDLLIVVAAAKEMADGLKSTGAKVAALPIKDKTVEEVMRPFDPEDVVVLNWCEGLYRDERNFWDVPAELDRLGYIYTGSAPRTLKMAQSKHVVKNILESQGIPNPFSMVVTKHSLGKMQKWEWYPSITKPSNEHGSFGITRDSVVDNQMQLEDQVKSTIEQYPQGPVVVEDFILGDEFNVAIWGSEGNLEVLPLARINYDAFGDYHDKLCTFEAKWSEDSAASIDTKVECPAKVDDCLAERLRLIALRAYAALDLRDYGRIDLRVRNGIPYVLDVNANPDITSGAGFARAARRLGYEYGEMSRHLVDLAAARGGIK